MKSFRCGDVVPGCEARFTGSDPDIESQIRQHAERDHGMTDLSDETLSQVRAAIRQAE